MSSQKFFVKASPLLLLLFIDGMGLGLVFPILNELIFDPHSQFLQSRQLTPLFQTAMYGGIVGIFMLCWFFGAAILGDLSDKIGRKRSLLICLVGAFLSYFISAVAVEINSLWILIIGRIVSGLTSGSQPIAQAAIIDISHEEHTARNMGYILLAISLGFILGPLLGGVLADKNLVSWFTFSTPFYFAALMAFVNLLLLQFLFKETYVTKSTTFSINPRQAINIFISAFNHPKVRMLSLIFFIYIFGWSSFYSFIALYLLKKYQFGPTQVSFFMALMGVGFGIGNGFLVNLLAKRYALRGNFIVSTFICALIVLWMVLVNQALYQWLLVCPMAIALSVGYAAILTLFSKQVEADAQGWVMGITGSIMAFVFGINGIIIGFIAAYNAAIPIYLTVICFILAIITMALFFKPAEQ